MSVEIKEEQEQHRLMSSSGRRGSGCQDNEGPVGMEDTLGTLLKRLDDKRRDAGRPEDLSVIINTVSLD